MKLAELAALTENPTLRHPSGNISREKIDEFGLTTILQTLDADAPCLARLLGELIGRKRRLLATIGSMLIFHRSQKSNYLQTMMGLYLYSLGCPKRVISLLNDACLSVSHQTICIALTQSALESVRTAVRNQQWFLVYDNINLPNRKFHQRLDHTDDFENGKTATIVIGEDLGNEGPAPNQLKSPTIQDFVLNEFNREHRRNSIRFLLLDALRRTDDKYSWYRAPSPVLDPLQLWETITFPLVVYRGKEGPTFHSGAQLL
ncbi:hypothetical protein B0O80DRAFT_170403 [Mortierella sp. GBAus27b]|nr:hypothetical protein B0O80DRAFT_170403 [Mortierella sp. GBAus27b]